MSAPSLPRTSAEQSGWDRAALDGLLEWCEQLNTRQLMIVHRGSIIAEHDWGGPASADVASIQKSVISFVVGQLVARGELDLDSPASAWLGTRWTRAPSAVESRILLRHLLTMTSGLVDDFEAEAPPGSVWYYNNNAYHQVRKIIERVTGRTTAEVTAELVFEPIGMTDSGWSPRPNMVDPNGWVLSGLHSNVGDLARFGLAVLAGGRAADTDLGCDPGYLAASLRPSQSLNPSYGLLWWLFGGESIIMPGHRPGRPVDPRKVFGGIALDRRLAPSAPIDTVGAMGAGNQRVYLSPDDELVVVRLADLTATVPAAGPFDEAFWIRLRSAMPG